MLFELNEMVQYSLLLSPRCKQDVVLFRAIFCSCDLPKSKIDRSFVIYFLVWKQGVWHLTIAGFFFAHPLVTVGAPWHLSKKSEERHRPAAAFALLVAFPISARRAYHPSGRTFDLVPIRLALGSFLIIFLPPSTSIPYFTSNLSSCTSTASDQPTLNSPSTRQLSTLLTFLRTSLPQHNMINSPRHFHAISTFGIDTLNVGWAQRVGGRFTVRRDPRVLANVREEERPPKQELGHSL